MMYAYHLTMADYRAAQRLHLRCHIRARLWYLLWVWVFPALGLAAAILFARDILLPHPRHSPVYGGVFAALIWLGLFGPISREIQVRRGFRQLREDVTGPEHPVELELHDEELISRIPGRSEARFQPSAFRDFVEDDVIALLYVRKKMFLFIPKRALPEEGWAALRAWSGKGRRC